MKARLVIITALLCLALTACSSAAAGQNTDPAPKPDTSAGQTSAAETPDKEPVSDESPAGTPVSEDTLKQLQELFPTLTAGMPVYLQANLRSRRK